MLSVTATACESTEQESAKLGREDRQLVASQGTLKLGPANHSVRVGGVTLLRGQGRMAVAASLTLAGASAQTNLPVLVDVSGARGKVLYSNEAGGLEASLQRVPLLRPGQRAWWVDDQVLASQPATGVELRVGTGSPARSGSAPPSPTTTAVRVSQQSGLSVLSGSLVNHSTTAQSKVPVFAVAVSGGRIRAAGRAVVSALPGRPGASVPFQIFLVGNAAGATIELTVGATGG